MDFKEYGVIRPAVKSAYVHMKEGHSFFIPADKLGMVKDYIVIIQNDKIVGFYKSELVEFAYITDL